MIYVDKNTRIPSVDETLGTLRMHNNMLPMFIDFDKLMMNLNYIQLLIPKVSGPLFQEIGRPPKVSAADNMKAWLINHNMTAGFDSTKTGISLEKSSVDSAIESGKLTQEAIDLLRVYQKYSEYTKIRSTLIGLLQNPISNAPSCDGHRMLIIKPTWHPQNTGRVAMRDPAVQNFQHQLQELLTVPEGYIKLHTDSGQIEPRLTYSYYIPDKQIQALINLYNDAYYGLLHYCTMAQNIVDSGTLRFSPMEITPELKDMRQLIKRYGNGVMYGSKSNPTGDPIKAAMIKRIGEHPLRQQLIDGYAQQIRMGQTVFKTALGTPIDTGNSKKLDDGYSSAGSIEEGKLRLAINNPIQGTAADLMRLSVAEANRILMNKAKKSVIVAYMHDAGVFAVHEDEFSNLEKELGDIVSYQVEGWLPIYAEPDTGRRGGADGFIKDLY